ncbi:unnamed protein product [Periconia digitata]|uniref:Uncharacterized protein n=1 Tax=Periconia digitata TaxID=1303443 RepID=A0A9W4UJP6_9PLEO|nr:unnamed protein product [Periconia digitata]
MRYLAANQKTSICTAMHKSYNYTEDCTFHNPVRRQSSHARKSFVSCSNLTTSFPSTNQHPFVFSLLPETPFFCSLHWLFWGFDFV